MLQRFGKVQRRNKGGNARSRRKAAFAHLFEKIRHDGSGNVAIIFALTAIPIVGFLGAAVDYSNANKVRTALLAAIDAAAVGSLAKSSPGMLAATTMSADGSIPAGVADAVNIFNANLSGKSGFNLQNVSAAVALSNGKVTSTVSFSALVPAYFLGVFGKKAVPIAGSSSATNNLPVFIDFYLLLDNTPSMGVGATTNDINMMVDATKNKPHDANCAFACHNLDDSNNYYNLAKSLGVTMRIDVLRSATQQLMDTAKATEIYSNQFRMAIYTFGASATNEGLTTLQSLTSNLSQAKTAAGNIDLMTVPYQNYRLDTQTDFGDVLTDMNSTIPNPGNGTSSSSRKKYLFFVSDGLTNRAIGSPACSKPTFSGKDPQTQVSYVRCQEPLDAAFCTTIKNRGIKIAVLYTTYLPLPTNSFYNTWIAPFAGEIATKMQSCASPGLYFEVGPNEGISDAMNALFQKAVAEARLTK